MNRRAFLYQTSLFAAAGLSGGCLTTNTSGGGRDQARFDVRRFGAKGTGQTKDTKTVQGAIDAAGRAGGCVYFPPGRYLCGTLHLRSHVTLQFENGATLVGSPEPGDFDAYEKLSYNSFSDEETTYFNSALICGREVEHVAILGPGSIDMARNKRHGPKPIALKLCRNVLIRDLTIENAPNYNISLLGCDFVDILGVTIRNGYADGIDPDCCRHVRIANCYIESSDDAIVPKASPSLGYLRPTEYLTVTNCVLTTTCNAFKLGTESSGGFKDIVVSNCAMFSNTELWHGRRATSGISIEMVDGGALERVAVSNITMRDVRAPIYVRLANRGRGQPAPTPQHLSNISISDIVATGAILASSVTGIPGYPVIGVTLKNIRVTTRGGGPRELAFRTVPEKEQEYPDANRLGDLPGYGLYCRHADSLVLEDMNFAFEAADSRPAIFLDDVKNVDLRALVAKPPAGDQPVARFHNVRDSFIQGCRALADTNTWASITGDQTAGLAESGNDFSHATKPFEIGTGVPEGAFKMGTPKSP